MAWLYHDNGFSKDGASMPPGPLRPQPHTGVAVSLIGSQRPIRLAKINDGGLSRLQGEDLWYTGSALWSSLVAR